jgi:hypothetical protein
MLDLSACAEDVGPDDIAALQAVPNLEDLRFRVTRNGVAPAVTRQLSQLPRLRSLDVSKCALLPDPSLSAPALPC